ncbi:hypothetical protein B0T21DRAFT_393348 [Apiosordaria backusii]|uniref:Uncharacterized protein n=1 Tax=Apiosordaria backusii TaxID=314023 RepID=A0AA40BM54_9PEZI|nr:hypothetical protein B0T21DRAFT_393348 [Apiosordaria backusii]
MPRAQSQEQPGNRAALGRAMGQCFIELVPGSANVEIAQSLFGQVVQRFRPKCRFDIIIEDDTSGTMLVGKTFGRNLRFSKDFRQPPLVHQLALDYSCVVFIFEIFCFLPSPQINLKLQPRNSNQRICLFQDHLYNSDHHLLPNPRSINFTTSGQHFQQRLGVRKDSHARIWARGPHSWRVLALEFRPPALEIQPCLPDRFCKCDPLANVDIGDRAKAKGNLRDCPIVRVSDLFNKTYGDLETNDLNPVFAQDRQSSVSHRVQKAFPPGPPGPPGLLPPPKGDDKGGTESSPNGKPTKDNITAAFSPVLLQRGIRKHHKVGSRSFPRRGMVVKCLPKWGCSEPRKAGWDE